MLKIRLDAPFAVFRPFTAGWFRPTASFITPTAAYGLLLNIAGIESRVGEHEEGHDGKTPATLTRPGLPPVRLALGVPAAANGEPCFPSIHSLFQQLHNYPVGRDAGIDAALAKGAKNNITPVRREFLADLRCVIAVDADEAMETQIREGLNGRHNDNRYGLPFLGDNSFLPDRIECLGTPETAYWYRTLADQGQSAPNPRTVRLTTWIDRADMTGTRSQLFAPADAASPDPPDDAWVTLPPL